MPVPQPSSGENMDFYQDVFVKIFHTNNISLVPISGFLLLHLFHPGDHDVTGGEHDAPHVAHHLPPRQPQLLTLPLVPRISVKNIFGYLTFIVIPFSRTVFLFTGSTKIRTDYHAILLISAVSGPSLVADNIRQRG